HQARRWIQRLVVDADRLVRHHIVRVQHLAIRIGDAPAAEQLGHVLAAAVTEVGDQLHQLHARTPVASITLNPSCVTSVRTSRKRWPSTASYGRWRFATSSKRPSGTNASAALVMKARPSSGRSARPWWNGGLLTIAS